ncbi:MAG: type IV secretory system conjugative DNA transfer family protein, partial [Oscillospiraceae bacterium]|nr:type IV secretory system conjugative DNA transfer family protein [Oscillospiraceae bacterium]
MNTAKIKKYILPTLPYIFVFWFFCKFGEEDRISNGADVIHRLTNTMISLNKVMANPMISLNIRDIFVGIFGAAGVYAIVYIRKKNAKKYRKDVEYGSARWGNKKDIEPFADLKSEKNIILTATESLTLNSRPKNPKYA